MSLKGEKTVKLITNNRSKVRTTVGAAITSEGESLEPLFVGTYMHNPKKGANSKTQSRDYPKKYEHLKNQVTPFMLRFTPTSFSNESLMLEWIDRVLLPYAKKQLDAGVLVVFLLDAASFHTSERVVKKVEGAGIKFLGLPAGCTDFLQPLDVCINKPMKDIVRKSYIQWLERCYGEGEFYTKGGYLRAPELSIFLKWITDACAQLKKTQIENSFTVCGIKWGLHENVHLNQKLLSLFEDLVSKVSCLPPVIAYVNTNLRFRKKMIMMLSPLGTPRSTLTSIRWRRG